MIAWISDTRRPLDLVKWIISAPTITPVPPIGIASVVWEGVWCGRECGVGGSVVCEE